MRTDIRYSSSDCFETFPFPLLDPRARIPPVEDVGQRLYDFRAKYMVDENIGLTITYNRLKDPHWDEARILELRRLHEEMDREVLKAYGWDDIAVPPYCPKTPDDTQRLKAFEDEVIDRLFVLNAKRAEEEKLVGLGKPAKSAGAAAKPKAAKERRRLTRAQTNSSSANREPERTTDRWHRRFEASSTADTRARVSSSPGLAMTTASPRPVVGGPRSPKTPALLEADRRGRRRRSWQKGIAVKHDGTDVEHEVDATKQRPVVRASVPSPRDSVRRQRPASVSTGQRPSPTASVRRQRPASVSTGQRPSPTASVRRQRPASVSTGQRPSPTAGVRRHGTPSVANGWRPSPRDTVRRQRLASVATGHRPSPTAGVRRHGTASVATGQRPSPTAGVRRHGTASVATGQRPSPRDSVRRHGTASVATGQRPSPTAGVRRHGTASVATGQRPSPWDSIRRTKPRSGGRRAPHRQFKQHAKEPMPARSAAGV